MVAKISEIECHRCGGNAELAVVEIALDEPINGLNSVEVEAFVCSTCDLIFFNEHQRKKIRKKFSVV